MQISTSLDPAAAVLPSTSSVPADFASTAAASAAPGYGRKRINSQALLGGERELEIDHGGQLYRLRITALGKLILTK
jgi:hemin uptake protein HemP